MPRGGHKVKAVKPVQAEVSAPLRIPGIPSLAAKPARTNTDRKASILATTFLPRNSSETKLASSVPDQPLPIRESSSQQTPQLDLPVESGLVRRSSEFNEKKGVIPNSVPNELERSVRPTSSQSSLTPSAAEEEEDTYEAVLNRVEGLRSQATQSSAASSIYSRDSASIYSSASSIYSSGASIYSFDECGLGEVDRYARKGSTALTDVTFDSRLPDGSQYQQRVRTSVTRQQEVQDAASRERSTLAKKAALFKNSRFAPQLPAFNASLPTWAMVCRAVRASQDCYDSQTLTRWGTYTPADSSKDIKAMIIDDQLIDDSRLVVISVRGTQFQSLSDWTANAASNPVKPVGFLDDEENGCHAGFLQVAKAMVIQVAAQLRNHKASSEKPALLFTGHSAGGAVAAMLYSHMLSTSVNSDLTALASWFPSINCVTFGAPPLSVTPLPKRDHKSGVFLSFANEGDPVLRLSNAAYFKSLAKLMTASPPQSAATATLAPPVKVVRGSRGAAVYRQALPPPPPTPWEELPLWPTPPCVLTNGGEVIILRDGEKGVATASRVTPEEMADVIFGDLEQHTVQMYIRRVKEVSVSAMMGRI